MNIVTVVLELAFKLFSATSLSPPPPLSPSQKE